MITILIKNLLKLEVNLQFLKEILALLRESPELAGELFNFEKSLAKLHYTKEFKKSDNKYFISNTDNHLNIFLIIYQLIIVD